MLPLLREEHGSGTSTAEERVIGAGLRALDEHAAGFFAGAAFLAGAFFAMAFLAGGIGACAMYGLGSRR